MVARLAVTSGSAVGTWWVVILEGDKWPLGDMGVAVLVVAGGNAIGTLRGMMLEGNAWMH